jgi:hypothetical protein
LFAKIVWQNVLGKESGEIFEVSAYPYSGAEPEVVELFETKCDAPCTVKVHIYRERMVMSKLCGKAVYDYNNSGVVNVMVDVMDPDRPATNKDGEPDPEAKRGSLRLEISSIRHRYTRLQEELVMEADRQRQVEAAEHREAALLAEEERKRIADKIAVTSSWASEAAAATRGQGGEGLSSSRVGTPNLSASQRSHPTSALPSPAHPPAHGGKPPLAVSPPEPLRASASAERDAGLRRTDSGVSAPDPGNSLGETARGESQSADAIAEALSTAQRELAEVDSGVGVEHDAGGPASSSQIVAGDGSPKHDSRSTSSRFCEKDSIAFTVEDIAKHVGTDGGEDENGPSSRRRRRRGGRSDDDDDDDA